MKVNENGGSGEATNPIVKQLFFPPFFKLNIFIIVALTQIY